MELLVTDSCNKPCVQCGKPVEPARECYAHPTCYGCLPPPEPLPVNHVMSHRCNKPLPGGRFLCSREAGHRGRCLRSVYHCTLFEPWDMLYAPTPQGPWMPKAEYEKLRKVPDPTSPTDRAVVVGVDHENGVVTVASAALVPDPRNPTIPDKPPYDRDPYERFARPGDSDGLAPNRQGKFGPIWQKVDEAAQWAREDARNRLRERNRLLGYDRPSMGRNGMAVVGYEPTEAEVDEYLKARNDD